MNEHKFYIGDAVGTGDPDAPIAHKECWDKRPLNRVAITTWEMSSDPGYVPSGGHQAAHVVPLERWARIALMSDYSAYRAVTVGNMPSPEPVPGLEPTPYYRRSGVCNYEGQTIIVEVPEDSVIVESGYTSISTDDESYYWVHVVDGQSLRELYERLSKEYAQLAEAES